MGQANGRHWILPRPEVRIGDVAETVEAAFGIAGELSELGSQQDRNFHLAVDDGEDLLVKVDNPNTTDGERDLQRAVISAYAHAEIRTPHQLHTVDGATHACIPLGSRQQTAIRVFEFIDGESLARDDAPTGVEAERLGRLAGSSVVALEGLDHPAAARDIQWELGRAEQVVDALIGFVPEDRQDRCLTAVRTASSELARFAPDLPMQIVHGDITADNVLAAPSEELVLLDLGDAGRSWRISELAVTAADVLGRTSSLAAVDRTVAGFHACAKLSEAELGALWPLIVLRGAVLAVSGWSQVSVDAENAYARERLEHEWRVFELAAGIDRTEAEAQLRLAAGYPHRAGTEYGPIVSGLDRARILDLGTTSPALDRGRWQDPGVEQEIVRDALEGAAVALAPFGEARLSRTVPDIASPGSTRTRCVEIWAAARTEILAPFGGQVSTEVDAIELNDAGVVIRIEGISPSAPDGLVAKGDVLGTIRPRGEHIPSMLVTRRIRDAQRDAAFGAFDAEYTTDGAADPSRILGLQGVPDPDTARAEEFVRKERALGSASERYYAHPPRFERGWGPWLIDVRGRAYLDLVNNVTAIGHSHPRLADAVGRQLHLLNTNSRFLYRAYADLVQALRAKAPSPELDVVIPVNSGSEAIDLAIRLAQAATGRTAIVAAREGYHGWTMAADSVSTSAYDNPAALDSRPEWVHLVDSPNPYRGKHRGETAASGYLTDFDEHLAAMKDDGIAPAAFLCEPVLGNSGGVVPPHGYLVGAYEKIRAAGGLAIADEVQVGYGRLGEAFWGSAWQGAVPDIIATAKAAGNAFPFGAVLTTRAIADALSREGMFFSSAGGTPVSAIAARTVLDVIADEGLQERARVVGAHLRERLTTLAEEHPLIGAIHGSGLYLGVELVRDRVTLEPASDEAAWICARMLDHGVIMQTTSERQNVLKVKPPLVLRVEEADAFVAALDNVLGELAAAH